MIDVKNRRLIAFGCSVTHGCELVSGAYHPDNIQNSYPNLLAQDLGIECDNRAIPGASNDYIFHDALSHDTQDAIVLVCWTSLVREYWVNEGLHWFFIPNWGACFRELKHDTVEVHPRNSKIVTDDVDLLDATADYYEFFMRHKTDADAYKKKIQNFHDSLQAVMAARSTPVIELSCIYTQLPGVESIDGEWTRWGRHPDLAEHRAIADRLRQKYFE